MCCSIQGDNPGGDLLSSSDESDNKKGPNKSPPKRKHSPSQDRSSNGNNLKSSVEELGDIFDEELDWTHSSDSESTTKCKRAAHKWYRARLLG